MDIRALPVAQGLAWFKQAIDLGGRNPRAVFGAAMLLILALYAAAMLMARNPEFVGRAAEIKAILCESCTDLGRERSFQGAGMLDILRAMQRI